MTARTARSGYTLFELIVVMAILLLLAAIILPSVGAFRGELAVARARAMEEGRPYRVAISQDGKRIRRAPDGADFAQVSGFSRADGSAAAVDYEFEHVTAEVRAEQDLPPPEAFEGWV